MADIRKRKGEKGTSYQVRYPSPEAKSGYAYASFDTLKEARAFTENLGALKHAPGGQALSVPEAVDRWLDICEKIGRDGREKVEPMTMVEYRRRAEVMKSYPWKTPLHELVPTDVVQFRTWLLEHRSRDLARRTLSSFHSVLIEMMRQGCMKDDPAAGITIRSDGRYEEDAAEVDIPTDAEMRDLLAATDALAARNKQFKKAWAKYKPMMSTAEQNQAIGRRKSRPPGAASGERREGVARPEFPTRSVGALMGEGWRLSGPGFGPTGSCHHSSRGC